MALVVLDASVIIAFRDPANALHGRAVAAFRAHGGDALVLPASAYAEVLVGPIRNSPAAVASLEAFLRDFAIEIAPLTPEITRVAAALRAATSSLRLPDALVLGTGEVLNANVVLTGDSAWAKLSSRVSLIWSACRRRAWQSRPTSWSQGSWSSADWDRCAGDWMATARAQNVAQQAHRFGRRASYPGREPEPGQRSRKRHVDALEERTCQRGRTIAMP